MPPDNLTPTPERRAALLVLFFLSLIGALFYLIPLSGFVSSIVSPVPTMDLVNRDFANYWAGGHSVMDGSYGDLFHQDVYYARLRAVFGEDYPLHAWSYPPHLLIFLWPLGLFGYTDALLLFMGTGIALFVFALVLFRRRSGEVSSTAAVIAAAIPFSMMAFTAAQNGFFTAALLLLGFSLARTRSWCAAAAFAMLTVKPQLGLLIPLWMAFDRNWSLIGKTALLSAALMAASTLLFGIEVWTDYLTATLSYQTFVMSNWSGVFLPMMPTAFGAVRTLEYSAELAYLTQWPVSLLSISLVVYLLIKSKCEVSRIYAVCAGTFLITPYAFNYDMGAIAVVAAVLVGSRHVTLGRFSRLAVATVAALPALVLLLGILDMPVAPLMLALSLMLLAQDTRNPGRDDRPTRGPSIPAEATTVYAND